MRAAASDPRSHWSSRGHEFVNPNDRRVTLAPAVERVDRVFMFTDIVEMRRTGDGFFLAFETVSQRFDRTIAIQRRLA